MSSQAATLLALAVVLLVAGSFAYALLSERRRRGEKARLADALGFAPMAAPDAELAARFAELLRTSEQRACQLRNVFWRNTGDADLYLFDLLETGSGDQDWQNNLLGVVSSYLDTPRLTLLSKLEMEGRVADWTNQLITRVFTDWGASRTGMQLIELDGESRFSSRFLLLGVDEEKVSQFLDSRRVNALLALSGQYVLDASGSVFVIRYMASPQGVSLEEAMRTLYRDTITLSRALQM